MLVALSLINSNLEQVQNVKQVQNMEQVDTEIDSVYSAILKSMSIRFQWHSINIINIVQNIHTLTAVTNRKSLS